MGRKLGPPKTRLDEVMQARGFNQARFARKIGEQDRTLGRWRSGERDFDRPTAKRMADILDVPVGTLYEEMGAPIPAPAPQAPPSPAAGEEPRQTPQDEDDLAFITRLLPELDAAGLTMVRATVTYLINGMRVDRAHLIPTPPKRKNDPTA